jgi:para-nitrobenzyl esterase
MRHWIGAHVARVAGMLLPMTLVMLGSSPGLAATNGPVRTEEGLVSGVPGQDSSIAVYKGISFAASPVGDVRWRPPQPPSPWHGVRRADQFGDICPQTQMGPQVQ